MSSMTTQYQKLQIDDARLITVSDLVLDADGTTWVRTIRFYGDPVANGAPTAFAEIVTRSDNKEDLEIQAPGFKY
jgi:hypothetical protein